MTSKKQSNGQKSEIEHNAETNLITAHAHLERVKKDYPTGHPRVQDAELYISQLEELTA